MVSSYSTCHIRFTRQQAVGYRGLVPKGTNLKFSPAWRRTFGVLGNAVGWAELKKHITVASVRTFQRWFITMHLPTQSITGKRQAIRHPAG